MPTAIPIEITNAVLRAYPLRNANTLLVILDRWFPERSMAGCTFCHRREIAISRADHGAGRVTWHVAWVPASHFDAGDAVSLCTACLARSLELHGRPPAPVLAEAVSPIEPAMAATEVMRALREVYGEDAERWVARLDEARAEPRSPVSRIADGACLFCRETLPRTGVRDRGLCSACVADAVVRVSRP